MNELCKYSLGKNQPTNRPTKKTSKKTQTGRKMLWRKASGQHTRSQIELELNISCCSTILEYRNGSAVHNVCKLIFLHCLALRRLQMEYWFSFVHWIKVKINQMERDPKVQNSVMRMGFKGIRSCCVCGFVLSNTEQQTEKLF